MKSASLNVYVALVHTEDNDDDITIHGNRDAALQYIYDNYVKDSWAYRFEDEEDMDIDDYDTDTAVDRFFQDADYDYYNITRQSITYTVVELQDAINKAIGLKTSDG